MWWWQQIPARELGPAQGPMPEGLTTAMPFTQGSVPEVGVQPQAARVTSRDPTTGGLRISPGVVQAVGIAGGFFGVIGKAIAAIFGAVAKAQAAGPRAGTTPGTTGSPSRAGMFAGWFEPSPERTYAGTPFGALVQAGDPFAVGAARARAESAAAWMRITALEEEMGRWLATPQPVTPGGEEDIPGSPE